MLKLIAARHPSSKPGEWDRKNILAKEIACEKCMEARDIPGIGTFRELGVGCKGQDKRDPQAGPTGVVIWIVDCGWGGEKTNNLSRIEF